MTTESSVIESIIAADVGSTMTKATLIDRVEAEYRIVASAEFPSTFEPPWSDVSLGLQQCLARIEEIASRRLLDQRGAPLLPERADGSGVDAFVATASAAEPLRVAIMGLMRDYSVESARKATFSTYAQAETLIPMDGSSKDGPQWDLPARITALHRQQPAVIILAGGNEKGVPQPLLEIAQAVNMACKSWPNAMRPDVIFAGNSAAREQIAEKLGEVAVLHVVENVRPSQQSENLSGIEEELERIFVERRLNLLPGFATITSVASKAVMPTATAFDKGMRALSRHFGLRALGMDVGGATTSMAVHDEAVAQRVLRSDLGLSYNIENIARQSSMANILRWLPFEMSESEAWDRLANKALRPFTLPETSRELLLEQAAAREALRLTLRDLLLRWEPGQKLEMMPRVDLLVGTGGVLTHAPYPGQAVLMMLDALQPLSVVNLALYSSGLMPQLSLIASVQPQAAAHLTAHDGLAVLGTAICTIGTAKPGDMVVKYKMTYNNDEGGTVTGEVRAGEIEVLPLPVGQKANIELKPARGIDVGQGRGRAGLTPVDGGLVGVIIDARGRPLVLSANEEKRRTQNQEWLYNVGA